MHKRRQLVIWTVLFLFLLGSLVVIVGTHTASISHAQASGALIKVSPTPTERTPTPALTPTPRPTATPTSTRCIAVNGNPWCYNFHPGKLIYSPASAFCSYFACVSTFWSATSGYVAECANGKYTHSGGVRGACSRDGGVSRTLYSH